MQHVKPISLVLAALVAGCAGSTLETNVNWIDRMEAAVQPGQTRADVAAAFEGRSFSFVEEPRDYVRPPLSTTDNFYADGWLLVVETFDRVACVEQRHLHIRLDAEGRVAERVARGSVGCL